MLPFFSCSDSDAGNPPGVPPAAPEPAPAPPQVSAADQRVIQRALAVTTARRGAARRQFPQPLPLPRREDMIDAAAIMELINQLPSAQRRLLRSMSFLYQHAGMVMVDSRLVQLAPSTIWRSAVRAARAICEEVC